MKKVIFSVEVNSPEVDKKGVGMAIDMAKTQVQQFSVEQFDKVDLTLEDEHVTVNYQIVSMPDAEDEGQDTES